MKPPSEGSDSFGEWEAGVSSCEVCSEAPVFAVRYRPGAPLLPDYNGQGPLLCANLVIRKADAVIGVTCGCYAKFHRQVAHIVTEAKLRKEA